LIITGAMLKIPELATWIGRRTLLKDIHVWAGILLPFPLLIALCVPAGRMLRRDIGRFNRWTQDDRRWWSRVNRADAQLGKFNPGQKLNAVFIAATIVVMLVTGLMLRFPDSFSNSQRRGATFVHDATWLVLIVVITGHIVIALRDADALRSMFKGWVPEAWARNERPRWWAEEVRSGPSGDAAGDVEAGAQQGSGELRIGAREVTVGEGVDGRAGDGLGGREL
jgi:formate dehydrogenase subunit gamma